jgi:hypothetical protein
MLANTEQELLWNTVIYKQEGVWYKHQSTYYPSFAETLVGALVNNNTFINQGVEVLVTPDNSQALQEALSKLNTID